MKERKGRFAPTPSGPMHIGNASTALAAWLQVRSQGGSFVLRIEDIDVTRCQPRFESLILEDLRWLGLDWDEGPDVGGPHGPYRQSDRTRLYEEAHRRLVERNLLYPCYCSRSDLRRLAQAPHGISSEGPIYPGTCRHLSDAERNARAKRKTPSLRFAIASGQAVDFYDLVYGPQHFTPATMGDFIVRRADGVFSYQLAVVVDDAAMGITDVLRGYDLLDSTPRQILLYQTLGLAVPRFTHVPLLVGPDGERLSKRHGSIAISDLREAGVKPERVIGAIACELGLVDRPDPVSARDLIPEFDEARITKRDRTNIFSPLPTPPAASDTMGSN